MSAADACGIVAARGRNSAARDGDGATGVAVTATADASTSTTLGRDSTTLDDDIAAVLLITAADAGAVGSRVIGIERATTSDSKRVSRRYIDSTHFPQALQRVRTFEDDGGIT